MAREDLEKVIKSKVKPIIDDAMQKFIGARIVEIESDISDRVAVPLLDIDINTKIGFKKSKEMFKKSYITKLLQTRLGNISKVADILGIDRRSIHRLINSLKIDVEKIRKNLLSKEYAEEEEVKDIIEETLGEYRGIINSEKLQKLYAQVPELSKDILKELPKSPLSLKDAEEEFEKRFVLKALKENKFNVSETARKIGLRYETLHRKMKHLGL